MGVKIPSKGADLFCWALPGPNGWAGQLPGVLRRGWFQTVAFCHVVPNTTHQFPTETGGGALGGLSQSQHESREKEPLMEPLGPATQEQLLCGLR